MLKNDTLKNGTSRIGSYGSALPGPRVEVKSGKTKENGISHQRENGPHSSDEGNPYIKANLDTGCFRKIAKSKSLKSWLTDRLQGNHS